MREKGGQHWKFSDHFLYIFGRLAPIPILSLQENKLTSNVPKPIMTATTEFSLALAIGRKCAT